MPLSVHPMFLGLLLACAFISSACDDSSNSNGNDAGISTADARGVGSTTDAQLTNLGQSVWPVALDAQVGDAAIPVSRVPMVRAASTISAKIPSVNRVLRCVRTVLCISAHRTGSRHSETLHAPAGISPARGECRPIKHNVLVLFDTSESMNSCVTEDNQTYTDCCNGDCPGEWPVCEVADRPLSRLAIVSESSKFS